MNIEETTNINQSKLLRYYEKAGPDYEHWSKNFNMHFGFYEAGMNPFNREQLLENMNTRVFKELCVKDSEEIILLDMGCGLGATLRSARKRFTESKLKGVTIVPWQVNKAKELNKLEDGHANIEIIEADYCCTPFTDNSIDYIIALESSCHAPGKAKMPLLAEIHRVLKPGGRFVIADGFRKTNTPLTGLLKKAYQTLCESWVLEQLGNVHELHKSLGFLGFQKIKATDISWNVAPSVAHVPGTVVTFLIKHFFKADMKLTRERWDNLKSPLLTMLIGLAQHEFGYYLISATKSSI